MYAAVKIYVMIKSMGQKILIREGEKTGMADAKKNVIIGIDLGGTGIKIGIVDTAYEMLAQTSIPTGAERPYKQVIEDMGRTARRLLEDHGCSMEDCLGVGVGSPGTIDS